MKLRDGRRWLERVLKTDDGSPSPERALALWAHGMVACGQGDTGRALDLLQEAMTVARAAGDATAEAYAIQWLGMAHWMRGELPEATGRLREALDRHRAAGGPEGIGTIVPAQLGMVIALQGDPDQGIAVGVESVQLCDEAGEDWVAGWSSWNLAVAYWSRGDREDAVTYTRLALRHQRRIADNLAVPFSLELLAWAAADEGDTTRAQILLGAADAMWEPVGQPLFGWPELQHWSQDCRATAGAALPAATRRPAYQRGRLLTLPEAVAYALGEAPEDAGTRSQPPPGDGAAHDLPGLFTPGNARWRASSRGA